MSVLLLHALSPIFSLFFILNEEKKNELFAIKKKIRPILFHMCDLIFPLLFSYSLLLSPLSSPSLFCLMTHLPSFFLFLILVFKEPTLGKLL